MQRVRISSLEARGTLRSPIHDPPVITALGLVDASHWRFGRIAADGRLTSFAHGAERAGPEERQRFLMQCRPLRRRKHECCVSARDPDFAHAIALAVDDPDAEFAALVLLRDGELPPFDTNSLNLLQLALARRVTHDNGQTHVNGVRDAAVHRAGGMVFVLDSAFRIVLESRARGAEMRLPPAIEHAIRKSVASEAMREPNWRGTVLVPLPHLAVSVHVLTCESGTYFAVVLNRVRSRNVMRSAVERFAITPRERAVLGWLLDGLRTDEIAERMSIAGSTVTDHVKSLIAKTGAVNRSQMLGRVIGWENGCDDSSAD